MASLVGILDQISSGESPPSALRACFGRGRLIDRIVSLTENLTHHPLSSAQAGLGRRPSLWRSSIMIASNNDSATTIGLSVATNFPSYSHLLSWLSEVIGMGIENPEGAGANEIYATVKDLSRLDNVCLCVTSRISTIPPDCKILEVPPLSIDVAHDTFYWICEDVGQSDLVDTILGQLDFHPLLITCLRPSPWAWTN